MLHMLLQVVAGASLAASDVPVPSIAEQSRRLQDHYTTVVGELEDADVSHLTAAQRAERSVVIERLRDYGECANFGWNTVDPTARLTAFDDGTGRRCALAHLLYVSGECDLVERVSQQRNHAWLSEIADEPALQTWLAKNGVTIEEAARIHTGVIVRPVQSGGGRPAGGSYSGPGDTVGGGGARNTGGASTGGSSAAPATGTPTGGGGPSTPGGMAPTAGPRPTTATLTMTDDDSWWLWWEHNKAGFLRPNRLDLSTMPSTGDDEEGFLDAIERARRAAAALFASGVVSTEWSIRQSSAVALARTGGADAVDALTKLLDDANTDVRHLAILSLGTHGDARAATTLFAIARHGALKEGGARISPFAKAYAIVALGLTRSRGLDLPIDAEIETLVRQRVKSERESIATAALIYQMLAPSPRLEKLAIELANDGAESPSVRCRAVESLRTSQDSAVLAQLQTHLNGPRMDLRRSAALALGELDQPLALEALMTAFELEVEPLAKGFVLTAIGRQGGAKACTFLAREIARGETGMRRWAALGLGLLAHASSDPEITLEATKAIRMARDKEKNRSASGAYCIASGLARDVASAPAIFEVLVNGGDPRQRMYAATALALLDDEGCLERLRQHAKVEQVGLVRVVMAEAIAHYGRPVDSPLLVEILTGLDDAYEQAVCASAIGAHGAPETLRALEKLARDGSTSTLRRAASIEGLGVMLSRAPTLALSEVARGANYTVFTDWVSSLFQTTL